MGFEVTVEELRTAATKLRNVTSDLAGHQLGSAATGDSDIGHVELASWVKGMRDAAEKATQSLHDKAESMADDLGEAADNYETSDQNASDFIGARASGLGRAK